MAHDALAAHARDELGINASTLARPIQAALASASSFAVGAAPPAILAALLPSGILTPGIVGVTLVLLVVPFALIMGGIRGIPFGWRLIDCSFGIFGITPLWFCRKYIRELARVQSQA